MTRRIVWPLVADCVLVTVISAALFYALVWSLEWLAR
jgi:hypothetical protein